MNSCVFFNKRLSLSISIYLSFIILLNQSVLAQDVTSRIPETVIPASVGVNIHFVTGGAKDLDMISEIGFKHIRMDMFWNRIEKVKGKYDWSSYDTLIAELDQRNIGALFILDYNNSLYTDNGLNWGPNNNANIEAYKKWAVAAVKHFKGHNIIWEIWNEPNNRAFWRPYPNAAQYTKLAFTTCKAIHNADPSATIIAPAMVHFGWGFIDTLFQSGILKFLSAVSVHPYRDGPPPLMPETAASDFIKLKSLILQYAPDGKKIPVISGEWGYSSCLTNRGVPLQTQADYFARMQLFNLYLGLPLSIWYDWKNDGTSLLTIGQNRGLVTSDLKPKPLYYAAKVFLHELSGYYVSGRINTKNDSDVVLILKNTSGSVKAAVWTEGKSHNITLKLSVLSIPDTLEKIFWIDGNAKSGKLKINAGRFTDKISGTPKYYSILPTVPISIIKTFY